MCLFSLVFPFQNFFLNIFKYCSKCNLNSTLPDLMKGIHIRIALILPHFFQIDFLFHCLALVRKPSLENQQIAPQLLILNFGMVINFKEGTIKRKNMFLFFSLNISSCGDFISRLGLQTRARQWKIKKWCGMNPGLLGDTYDATL